MQRKCCLYNHKTSDPNEIKESATLEKEVKELKSDVLTLTKVLEDKEQKLQELSEMIANQNEKILELKAENSNLKSNLDKISSCEECKFISKTQNDLVAHQLSEHEKTENFACTKCEYNSKKDNDLKLHISTNHPVYPSNKCVFQTEGNQIVKKNKDTKNLTTSNIEDKKASSCDKCDFTYINQFDLLIHKSSKHPSYILNSQPEAMTGPLH